MQFITSSAITVWSLFIGAKVVIAVAALQLIGVSVAGLEPEFLPVVNHLLPNIISHKQDAHDMHLQVDHVIYTISNLDVFL